MDRYRYSRSSQFVYQFKVEEKPLSLQAKTKNLRPYKDKIKKIAKTAIDSVINSNDIEIEITWSTKENIHVRSDVDNIVKPIIDALKGIAFNDDKQIRTIVTTYFDLNLSHKINCYIEDYKDVFLISGDNVFLVTIYSNQKLSELGGEEIVNKKYLEQKLRIPNGE